MLFGFAPSAAHATDVTVFEEIRCDRIFTAADGFFDFRDIAGYFRAGDALAVVSLHRLSTDLHQLLGIMATLKESQVSLYVPKSAISPENEFSSAFIDSCCLLADLFTLEPDKPRYRTRGRPPALPDELKLRAAHLLRDGRHTISDVAELLHVSPATVYRYFPRSRIDALPATSSPATKSPAARHGSPARK